MDILETEHFEKVLKEGKASNEECEQAFEEIVRENYEKNGGFDFINYIDVAKGYANIVAEYNLISSLLMKLIVLNAQIGFNPEDEIFVQDEDIVKELAEYRFIIKTTSKKDFVDSINSCLNRVKNFTTRMKMKENELKAMFNGEGKKMTFDELMAMLIVQNINVEDDITLARYNQIIKILNERKQAA